MPIKRVRIQNLEDMRGAYKYLSRDLRQHMIAGGVSKIAGAMAKTMKAKAPKGRTGRLRNSIGRRAISSTAMARMGYKADSVGSLVGPNTRATVIGWDGKRKKISMLSKARWVDEGFIHRGGFKDKEERDQGTLIPGTHFMQGTADAMQSQMQTLFYQGFQNRYNRELRRRVKAVARG